jgi:nesprin-1
MAIQQGEKLYLDTGATGREKIRQQLRTAKDVWDSLVGDINDLQRKNDTTLALLGTYKEGKVSLKKWMLDVETWLKGDEDLKNSLQEKRAQLQNNKALLQDVTSHSRVVDSVIEKAKAVLQQNPSPEVKEFVQETPQKFTTLLNCAKEAIAKSEDIVSVHLKYQDQVQAATDWLKLMKDRLNMCTEITGDKHSVTNKLERVKVQALL